MNWDSVETHYSSRIMKNELLLLIFALRLLVIGNIKICYLRSCHISNSCVFGTRKSFFRLVKVFFGILPTLGFTGSFS